MTQSARPATRGAPCSQDQIAILRGMLEQQRRFRLDQLDQLQRSQDLGQLSDTEREISESLLAGARAALREVVDALQRMQDARYGTCSQCDAPLEIERLEVLPQVSLCMACQRAEHGE